MSIRTRFRPKTWLPGLALLPLLAGCGDGLSGWLGDDPGGPREERVWYVDADAPPGGDGTSWAGAFQIPQDAVDAAASGDEVWVAEGTYGRRAPGDKAVLRLKSGIPCLGGFAGSEETRDDRKGIGTPVTLDGEGAVLHVVIGASSTVLEGFRITGGKADGVWPDDGGGGMLNDGVADAVIANCVFAGNCASGHGGAMLNRASSPVVVNCTFTRNTAGVSAGGIYSHGASTPTFTNCIFWADSAPEIVDAAGAASTVGYSCVSGAWTDAGESNFDADPQFAAGGGVQLRPGSPCIDAGTSEDAPDRDIKALPRRDVPAVDGICDVGAHEWDGGGWGRVLHVKIGGTGDGSCWELALGSLTEALDEAEAGDEVWVAEGVFKPGTDREDSFVLPVGVVVYGGFAGTEKSLEARDLAGHETILSGDVNGDDAPGFVNRADNVYHVVIGAALARLDGFTVSGGHADGAAGPDDRGGGLLADGTDRIVVAGCTFTDSYASYSCGGMWGGQADGAVIVDCLFLGNEGVNSAGGLLVSGTDVTVRDCEFRANHGRFGAGLNASGLTSVSNCVFFANVCTQNGGGMTTGGEVHVTNCSFLGNSVPAGTGRGGGVCVGNGNTVLTNCLLWGNTGWLGPDIRVWTGSNGRIHIGYSCASVMPVFDGSRYYDEGGNLDPAPADPGVASLATGHAWLVAGSPCIDAGAADGAPDADIEGEARYDAGAAGAGVSPVDMGAYEWQGTPAWTVWHVKQDGTGRGSSWDDAAGDLADTFQIAKAGDEIWVAEGVYKPTDGTSRGTSFVPPSDVPVYGGFAGTETALDERDWNAHETILSGDIGTEGVTGDNSYNVVVGASDATLDGFTITAGNANGPRDANWYDSGAGVKARSVSGMTLANCRIVSNDGVYYAAGLYSYNSTLTVTGCTFDDNHGVHGGAVHIDNGSIQFSSCAFTNNTADHGGVLLNQPSSSTFTNCVFRGNSAQTGGVLRNSGGDPAFRQCTFVGNRATTSGAVFHVYQFTPTITNSICWGNTGSQFSFDFGSCTITYSDVEGGYGGAGNIDADPLFVAPGAGNLRLLSTSPCIDAGTDTGVLQDIEGNSRYDAPVVRVSAYDMGAYEWQGGPDTRIWHVKQGGVGDGSSWRYAAGDLREVLLIAVPGDEVWVAEGTYAPTTTTDRTISFVLPQDVELYGGFPAAGDPGMADRDREAHETVLTGDIGGGEQSYHVVQANAGSGGARLDGFSVTRGRAVGGAGEQLKGGGIYCVDAPATVAVANCTFRANTATDQGACAELRNSPVTFTDCLILENYTQWYGVVHTVASAVPPTFVSCEFRANVCSWGGGVFLQEVDGAVILDGCRFVENWAITWGGVVCGGQVDATDCTFIGNYSEAGAISVAALTLNRCSFFRNRATGNVGGAVSQGASSTATITNCVFAGNTAATDGGAIAVIGTAAGPATLTMTNCTVADNACGIGGASGGGGAVATDYCTTTITGSIFWDNVDRYADDGDDPLIAATNVVASDITYSCMQEATAGTGNITDDPLLAGPEAGNVRLNNGSPCIDAADPASSLTVDIDGSSRPVGTAVDMGACEWQGTHTPTIWYVKQGGTGDGSSWAEAAGNPNDVLAKALPGDEVWVAEGTYTPGTSRSATFGLVRNVALYGGFAGSETARDQRDWEAHETILSGDIGVEGDTSDNSYHVVAVEAENVVLDGLTVANGYADSAANMNDHGGGVFTDGALNFTMSNCVVRDNYASFRGGGTAVTNDSSATVTDCAFIGNGNPTTGGGFRALDSDATLDRCVFRDNTSTWGAGALLSGIGRTYQVTNCLFTGNSVPGGGAPLEIDGDGTTGEVLNCTIAGNQTPEGIYLSGIGENVYITNCIVWGQSTSVNKGPGDVYISNSCIQGCSAGGYWTDPTRHDDGGNIDADPLLAASSVGHLRLRDGSPCIDAGTATGAPTTDIDGSGRYNAGAAGAGVSVVDMGAYEWQGQRDPAIWYVSEDGTGDGTSWADAAGHPMQVIRKAYPGDEVWVARGVYHREPGSTRLVDVSEGLGLYGGFVGDETSRDERNPARHLTIFNGEDGLGKVCNVLWVRGDDTVVDGFTLANGYANGVGGDNDGGGANVEFCDRVTVANCLFLNNYAADVGGGLEINTADDFTLSGCRFVGNSNGSAFGGGGAALFYSTGALVQDCTFDRNSSPSGGGGLAMVSSGRVEDSVFTGNTGSNGAGVEVTRDVDFERCTFKGNTAIGSGGGLLASGSYTVTLTDCAFVENSASWGGGFTVSAAADATATGCVIRGNTATGHGGGVEATDAGTTLSLVACTVEGNSATSASSNGGGLQLTGGASAAVVNCAFTGNSAGDAGGGIHTDGVTLDVVNSTVAYNRCGTAAAGNGGGILVFGSTVNVTNSIVWGNTGPTAADNVTGGGTVTYSCVEGGFAGTGNIGTDPLFVAPAGGVFRLRAASPCIDAGTDTLLPPATATDKHGNARYDAPVAGVSAYDMGAYEWQGGTTNIWHVKEDGTGDGSSWEDASGDLRAVLEGARPGDEVWVAAGTYMPTAGRDRTLSFHLARRVGVYAGFTGDETLRSERRVGCNPTILTGDIGRPGVDTDNSYRVVTGADGATLDGFLVTRGYADGASWLLQAGGGMQNYLCTGVVVRDCVFQRNFGAHGGAFYSETADVAVVRCVFIDNESSENGGGVMSVDGAVLTVNRTLFAGNTAKEYGGGVLLHTTAVTTLTNCIFRGNSAGIRGGGVHNHDSDSSIQHCTFWGNSAADLGGAVCNHVDSQPVISSCILWNDTGGASPEIYDDGTSGALVTYSCVEGGWTGAGAGNITDDPSLADPGQGDLHLEAGSPCVDTAEVIAGFTEDFDGNSRPVGSGLDMGAYEYRASSGAGGIMVTSPVGGELVEPGDTLDIEWTSSAGIPEVSIELFRSGAWEEIAQFAPNSGTFAWTVTGPGAGDCLIRVADALDGAPADVSDGSFTVKGVTLVSPDGGESWAVGSCQTIVWEAFGMTDVKIELSRTGGTSWETVVMSTPAGDGACPWAVTGAAALNDCIVRVSDFATPSIYDESASVFSIVDGLDADAALSVWWEFDDVPGSATASDSSGTGNDGTAQLVDFLPAGGAVGGAASLATFDRDDSGAVDNPAEYTYISKASVVGFPTTAITTAIWVKTADIDQGIISYAVTGTDNEWFLSASQSLGVYARGVPYVTGVRVGDGRWHHLAATWQSGGFLQLYVDGTELYSVAVGADSLAAPGTLIVGQDQDLVGGGFQFSQAFDGLMDDLRIYGRVLTPEEIKALSSMGR